MAVLISPPPQQFALFAQTSDQAVANTVTETSIIGTGNGTMTLPANYLVAGKTLRIRIGGVYSTPALSTPSVLIKLKYGSTVIATVTTSSLLTAATALQFDGQAMITCRSVGTTGSVVVHGSLLYSTGAVGTNSLDALNNAGSPTTIDTTTANLLDVTIIWDSATTTRIVKTTISAMEALN